MKKKEKGIADYFLQSQESPNEKTVREGRRKGKGGN